MNIIGRHINVAIHRVTIIMCKTAGLYLSELWRAAVDDLVIDIGVQGDISVGPEYSNNILLEILEFLWLGTIIALANRNHAIMVDLKTIKNELKAEIFSPVM